MPVGKQISCQLPLRELLFSWVEVKACKSGETEEAPVADCVHSTAGFNRDASSCSESETNKHKHTMDQVQRVMNAAAWVASDTRKLDRGLNAILHDELHWLDVPERTEYKLGVMVYQCLYVQAPCYLADQLAIFHPNFVQNCKFHFFIQNAKFRSLFAFRPKQISNVVASKQWIRLCCQGIQSVITYKTWVEKAENLNTFNSSSVEKQTFKYNKIINKRC